MKRKRDDAEVKFHDTLATFEKEKDLWKERILTLKAEMLEFFPELDEFQRAQLVIQIVTAPPPLYHVTLEQE